ncbi:MAG TPA: GntR family transcriptional regulator [Tetrasphaera sp.]|uniref:GntR family transcriptional regulator n=1 Tax=Nostocoides sp. TaxID=1917966 RepID=UPI002C18C3F0|nr:GntR family transcriptional regulator [Tetrasphaera sp.]HNQ07110.1 GntR family transcriptional regulator [Tetrasphaera sp.]
MLSVAPESVTPAYEQIVTQVIGAIREGALAAGARLPTVRQLAGDLGLATNTVARAYRELEARGFVVTNGRKGTVVSAPPAEPLTDEIHAAATLFVKSAQRSGLDLAAALGVIRSAW